MIVMSFNVLDFSDQFFIFFRWFVFSVDESFNDIAHKQFTSDFTTKSDNVGIQLFFSVKSCCHITNQSRTNTWNFVNSVIDTYTSTTDTYTKISLSTNYCFTNFFTKDWVVSTSVVISTKVDDFMSF